MPLGFASIGVGLLAAGTVASAGVAAYNAYNQSGIEGDAQGMADVQFGEQQQYATMLNNLINDPSSITTDPGYKFNFEQGSDAVAREMGASGFQGSGNEAIALTQYGQGYAQNYFDSYSKLLANLSGLQTSSSNSNLLNSSSSAGQQSFNETGSLLASLGYMYGGGQGGLGGGFSSGAANSPSFYSGYNPNAGGLTYDTGYGGVPS